MSDTLSVASKKGSAANRSTHRAFGAVTEEVPVAEIKYHDGALLLPNGMAIPEAISLLQAREAFLQTKVNVTDKFDVFPFDGAYALSKVMEEMYGWAPATPIPGFWGAEPPNLVRVEIAPGKFEEVAWGRFTIPGGDGGFVQTSMDRDATTGRVCFSMFAQIYRKDEAVVRRLFEAVRAYLKDNSIYRGKAIKIRFRDDLGNHLDMPQPQFMDTSTINPNGLIYSEDIQTAVNVNLFTPIQRVHDLIANGIPVKRGVLLGGTFGTGKTLAATVASKLAVDNNITYVYVPRADELQDAIQFARQYQSPACVIFCEDIDRALNGERTVAMDDILNIIDGIDTKTANIITVLTTNNLHGINPAMLRPGRLDAVIEVTPPDAKAVERLIRFYGKDAVASDLDLTEAGEVLAGHIPATISEVVKRAKLAQVCHQPAGEKIKQLSSQAIVDAAKSMKMQLDLLSDASKDKTPPPSIEQMIRGCVASSLGDLVSDNFGGRLLDKEFKDLRARMGY